MKTCSALLAVAMALPLAPAVVAEDRDGEWLYAGPGYEWSFPRDHWAHREARSEWWYITGHLEAADDPAQRFAYQFTLFRVGIVPGKPDLDSAWASSGMIMGHAAVADITAGEHRFSELLHRETPFLGAYAAYPDRPLAWTRAPAGTDGRWELDWDGEGFAYRMVDAGQGFAYDLVTRPARPKVFQGPGGYSRKDDDSRSASLYYSFTRLETSGTVTLDGRSWRVRGTSWMDKEFGSDKLGPGQVGWDWFSLQLDDGRDLMLYVLRRADGGIDYASGTLVRADGTVRYLGREDWSLEAVSTWTSPATGAEYPSRWWVRAPSEGVEIEVVPEMPDQENVSRLAARLHYWEGAVRVLDRSGATLGRGFVELTGYGDDNRPPL